MGPPGTPLNVMNKTGSQIAGVAATLTPGVLHSDEVQKTPPGVAMHPNRNVTLPEVPDHNVPPRMFSMRMTRPFNSAHVPVPLLNVAYSTRGIGTGQHATLTPLPELELPSLSSAQTCTPRLQRSTTSAQI